MFSGAETDDFLATMTFAAGDLLGMGCECDECECEAPGDAVPPTIRNAVDEHLKKRQLEHPSVFEGSKRLCIRQSREMVKREDGFSIWKLDLPLDGGDPIVEYRNSHRVVFVKQLRKKSHVLSIGEGIIGSATEEQSRKRVFWEEGESYFFPCQKGIACGWVHKLAEDDNADAESEDLDDLDALIFGSSSRPPVDVDNVVIYSLKVSPETLEKLKDNMPEDTSCWVRECYKLFSNCLAKSQLHQKGGDQKGKSSDDTKSQQNNDIVQKGESSDDAKLQQQNGDAHKKVSFDDAELQQQNSGVQKEASFYDAKSQQQNGGVQREMSCHDAKSQQQNGHAQKKKWFDDAKSQKQNGDAQKDTFDEGNVAAEGIQLSYDESLKMNLIVELSR